MKENTPIVIWLSPKITIELRFLESMEYILPIGGNLAKN